MAEHIKINEHLTPASHDAALMKTYLGQAHIAGTGPEGKTCRECVFWHKFETVKIDGAHVTRPCAPGYLSKGHAKNPGELKKAGCNRPILNKAKRLIPHHASACRLFEQNDNPPDATQQ